MVIEFGNKIVIFFINTEYAQISSFVISNGFNSYDYVLLVQAFELNFLLWIIYNCNQVNFDFIFIFVLYL